jgi:hypothetical protein
MFHNASGKMVVSTERANNRYSCGPYQGEVVSKIGVYLRRVKTYGMQGQVCHVVFTRRLISTTTFESSKLASKSRLLMQPPTTRLLEKPILCSRIVRLMRCLMRSKFIGSPPLCEAYRKSNKRKETGYKLVRERRNRPKPELPVLSHGLQLLNIWY